MLVSVFRIEMNRVESVHVYIGFGTTVPQGDGLGLMPIWGEYYEKEPFDEPLSTSKYFLLLVFRSGHPS
jgi:hypothetical protein